MIKKDLLSNKYFVAALFLLPALLFSLVYLIIPIPLSAYYSFFKWDGIGAMEFLGFDNWIKLFRDPIFWSSMGNNFKLVAISLIVQIPIALFLAVLLTRKIKGASFFKTIFFVPMLISSVAVALLWRYMYDPSFGLFNSFLNLIGLEQFTQSWLGNADIAFYSASAPIQWRFIPLYMIIFMAAIANIPKQLYEAAEIDGANNWQSFIYVTLPILRSTVVNASVLIIVGSLKYFAMIFALTGGGPNHASEVMATYLYSKSFTEMNMGYGSTISVALFLVALIVSVVFLRFSKKDVRN
ncbi:MAG: carbohydrate ABC transporter permease [Bacillota bacterium]